LAKNFADAGFKSEVRDLASFQDDYGLEPVEGEDELVGDEEEDEDEEMEDDEDEDEDNDDEE